MTEPTLKRVTYVKVKDKPVASTMALMDGSVYADYDEFGDLVGVEFLCPANVTVSSLFTKAEARDE